MSIVKGEKQVNMSADSGLKVYSSELKKFAEITDNMLCRRQWSFVLFYLGSATSAKYKPMFGNTRKL